jgi:chromosomal replication initiation ATPase DnaA
LPFVTAGVPGGRRGEFHRGTCEGRLLGDDRFVEAALGISGKERSRTTVANVLDAVCQVYGCSREELRARGKVRPFTEARAVASAIIKELPHLSLTELGRELNRDIAPLGRVGRRIESKAVEDERLRELLDKVKKQLRE